MLLAASIVGLFVLPGPWNVILLCVAAVVEVGEIYLWIRFLGRYRVRGGAEGMVGERAIVLETLNPDGRVRVRGEIWRATGPDGIAVEPGAKTRVVEVSGLHVRVDPE